MESQELVQHLLARAAFRAAGMTKIDCFRSARLLVGLNCFEPGQSQRVHVHGGTDKFYLVVSGRARMTVGGDNFEAAAGAVVWAPADLPHGCGIVVRRFGGNRSRRYECDR